MSLTGSAMPVWRKSSRCESQQCVEVARLDHGIAIRDSKDPQPQLVFDSSAWRAFIVTLRTGHHLVP